MNISEINCYTKKIRALEEKIQQLENEKKCNAKAVLSSL